MPEWEATSSLLREVHRRVLRRLREEAPRRLTQRELAERVGLSREQVVALESGRSALTESALARYLAAHGLAVSTFFQMAARVAEEVEARDGSSAATAPPPSAGRPAGLPPGPIVLWQRRTAGEVLALVQLPGAGRPPAR
ncbi:MAG TPA: helix-turn-helix transcriptional regulator [Thermoanaerobaculia bacterium]|nr:helix-turn-helix transcriptional regulator [Thermoanaerobaculia bacterium]